MDVLPQTPAWNALPVPATWPRSNTRNAAPLEFTHRALEKIGVSVSFFAYVAHAARSARGIGFRPDRP